MINVTKATGLFTLGFLAGSALFGQAQESRPYTRDNCVKVRDGKYAEYSSYLRDVTTKLAKVRLDSGAYSSFIIAQAVAPAGRSARCDFHVVYGSAGFPPEAPSPEQTAADMKKAGIAMTREDMVAKRDSLSYLVGVDTWRIQETVGVSVKGGYARLNYYKTKPGMALSEWTRMEATGWKPLAETLAKETPGMAWSVRTLAMPSGTSLPYNGVTIDSFPSWDAMGKGIQTRALWNKVHTDGDMTAYMDRLAMIVDRPMVDIVKLVEVIRR